MHGGKIFEIPRGRVSHWTSLIKEYMGENLEEGINQDLLLTIQTKERLKEKFKI